MITPKTYLDNLEKCKLHGVIMIPGCDPCYAYTFKGRSIGYSLSYGEDGRLCHIVSFDKGRDGEWYLGFLSEMEKRFGKPNHSFVKNGIAYFEWRESHEA